LNFLTLLSTLDNNDLKEYFFHSNSQFIKIVIFQDSTGLKSFISLSFSTINLTATDCTLQADKPFLTFFHKTGLTLYQTNLSKILLAC